MLMTPECNKNEGAPSHTDGAPSSHMVVADYSRLLHEGDLLRCFRNSASVTYVSTLLLSSSSAPCISSFVQSLSTFETNVREWHFVQHSLLGVGDDAALSDDGDLDLTGVGELVLHSLSDRIGELDRAGIIDLLGSDDDAELSTCLDGVGLDYYGVGESEVLKCL